MDVHRNLEGLTAGAVAGAHGQDLEIQSKYGVKYLDYWFSDDDGTVFYLAEAPTREAADRVHHESHGGRRDRSVTGWRIAGCLDREQEP
jgi:hypothetical protein